MSFFFYQWMEHALRGSLLRGQSLVGFGVIMQSMDTLAIEGIRVDGEVDSFTPITNHFHG